MENKTIKQKLEERLGIVDTLIGRVDLDVFLIGNAGSAVRTQMGNLPLDDFYLTVPNGENDFGKIREIVISHYWGQGYSVIRHEHEGTVFEKGGVTYSAEYPIFPNGITHLTFGANRITPTEYKKHWGIS
jgi:hypothetical protein